MREGIEIILRIVVLFFTTVCASACTESAITQIKSKKYSGIGIDIVIAIEMVVAFSLDLAWFML